MWALSSKVHHCRRSIRTRLLLLLLLLLCILLLLLSMHLPLQVPHHRLLHPRLLERLCAPVHRHVTCSAHSRWQGRHSQLARLQCQGMVIK